MRMRRGVDGWVLGAAGVTVALGVVSAVLPAVTTSPLTTGDGELRRYLDVVEEGNLPTWWASTVLVLAAAACAVVAAQHGPGPDRRRWAVLAVLVTALSLDETTSLHERLHRLVGLEAGAGFPFVWLVPGAVVGAALMLAVGALLRAAPRSTRWWLLGGLGLLLVSALGGELVQGLLLAEGSTGPAYVLTYHAEEAGETLGAVAVLRAAAARIAEAQARLRRTEPEGGAPTRTGPAGGPVVTLR